jgi:hypothetical protein
MRITQTIGEIKAILSARTSSSFPMLKRFGRVASSWLQITRTTFATSWSWRSGGLSTTLISLRCCYACFGFGRM